MAGNILANGKLGCRVELAIIQINKEQREKANGSMEKDSGGLMMIIYQMLTENEEFYIP